MIYTPKEYSEYFRFGGKYLSEKSIRRRCIRGLLPKGHIPTKKSSGWIIEIPELSHNIISNYNINLTLKK